tara:strand:- start:245 stop:1108 length:864 start_codon:yes stop_codon:yes gene_type:complete
MTKSIQAMAAQGLKIQKIIDTQMLEGVLDEGLAALYCDVFAGPPYNEEFYLEEAKDIFRSYFEANGKILLGRGLDTDEIEAFVVATPLKSKFDVASAAGVSKEVDQYFYIAEDGVSEAFRCRGISTRMKGLLLEECFANGYGKGLIRTSDRNYKQISAINKTGGGLILDVFQDVARTVKGGAQEIDRSCLFEFNNRPSIKPLTVPHTQIRKLDDGRDIAFYEMMAGIKLPPRILSELILRCYPGLDDVVPIGSLDEVKAVGTLLFDGRLYLSPPKLKPLEVGNVTLG